ncbi:MAG: type III pantothenate kinase [Pseudanabaenaceae cyanobacterium]
MAKVSRLAIAVGNSSVRGAAFVGDRLWQRWRIPLDSALGAVAAWQGPWDEVWLASVVPTVTAAQFPWPHIRTVTLTDIPLQNLYPTLGIDRALVLWGAWQHQPLLAVDGGTALTLTGVDAAGRLVGGAILPGVAAQLQSLQTLGLAVPQTLSDLTRWGDSTPAATGSGVLWGLAGAIAGFVRDWQNRFPDSDGILTGGSGPLLHPYLQASGSDFLRWEPDALFHGLRRLWTET